MLSTIDKKLIFKSTKQKTPEEQEAIASGIMTPILLEEIRKRLGYDEGFISKLGDDLLDKLYEP